MHTDTGTTADHVDLATLTAFTLNLNVYDPELSLVHDACGTELCETSHGDDLATLTRVALDHLLVCTVKGD